ncbi:MAG: bifunctional DNA-formamidopyrimidine glycosylase/DNA-(apurinic or apyrimidinic site) lyase [Rhodospirillaceae bacterium]|jgi:formamidopyrimidine-DNA glycosylase|nr:bifunctional DNA-formamidopyrimidine glycosylase/DNA-(apurinic or apyrimidinic site) lyase [Rhodospirillaceae bacterium]MBT4938135.1 bifunctional DNA-formamidopyrimidine glycosylase/DNA-(apurinic or apyrimidinic site) lyase [Rhodospirillaceae bacterium]MBT5939805.1 bifunctional DNA-formamidopyrimidine glycosylase/DNA-(apurinic or apyrimidinic site) lyase [Rhodospirillaceae bacterium]MBT7266030.1 bifunctional DNA-formamidopyrimidine glycosylase/DNA-(apurinic or apyrimidinic site) lyase [Rhodos
MPELPEVETVRRGLQPALEGQKLKSVIVRRPNLRIPFPKDFAARLTGKKITRLDRRAKYLLMFMETGDVAIIHLGMSGFMTVLEGPIPEPGKHDHVDFCTTKGAVVRFNDARRFGLMTLTTEDKLESHKLIKNIGPDPTGNSFNEEVLAAALAGRATPIKAALLDQKNIAGLGNIYVSESLFRSGISPRRLAKTVKGARAEKLTRAIREVLADAIAAGGSSLKDHVQPDGELGYFQHHFKVYGKEGEDCPECASAKIKKIVQSGRSTFYCSNCQR